MKITLLAIGVLITGLAFKATRKRLGRKFGVLLFILSTGIFCFALTHSYIAAIFSMLLWFLFPWLELLLCVRKQKFPLDNELKQEALPAENYFPEAAAIRKLLIEKGCTHLTDYGWKWANSHEHYSFFLHQEKKHLIAISHRIQSCITFCYVTILSKSEDGTTLKSSNFPFRTHLPYCSKTKFNHVTEGNLSCPEFMLYAHDLFLYEKGIETEHLCEENICQPNQFFEHEMRKQVDYNLKNGFITLTGDGHFKYSFKGLFFLWMNILRDMYRLC